MKEIELARLTLDPRLQPRDRIDDALVKAYAEDMGRGDMFPPIRAVQNGKAIWVVDGWHRVHAAKSLGLAEIAAHVTPGSFEDAEDLSFTVNRDHGLRRTHQDVQTAIARALKTDRWVARSDSWIGEWIGCSFHTVQAERERLEATQQIAVLDALLGKDGKHRPRTRQASALVIQDSYTLEQWTPIPGKDQKRILAAAADLADTAGFNKQDTDAIEWARWSWNPVTGCLHNCPYCYARDIAERFYPQKFAPTLHPKRLRAPQRVVVPEEAKTDVGYRNVFTCSMADLFGRWVPDAWIDAVLRAMRDAPQWNFLLLTKFPVRLSAITFPDNVWVGTSVDCQARVEHAERAFRRVKARVKWLSCEPMLEPLKFADLSIFDWVVIGGASVSTQTPVWQPPREWVSKLETEAWKAGCRVYEKTNLIRRWRQYPGHDDVPPHEAPAAFQYLKRVRSEHEALDRESS